MNRKANQIANESTIWLARMFLVQRTNNAQAPTSRTNIGNFFFYDVKVCAVLAPPVVFIGQKYKGAPDFFYYA